MTMETGERAYEKIINYVENQIMQGKYRTGDRLPPERELAALLGSSRNSVRKGLVFLNGWVRYPVSRVQATLYQVHLKERWWR